MSYACNLVNLMHTSIDDIFVLLDSTSIKRLINYIADC